ncbi:MAG: dihydrofolate reductase family protein [Solirubrobacteraceae bacterium]
MLRALLPSTPGGAENVTVRELVEEIFADNAAARREDRPRVLLNMASTLDGRSSIDGRSGPIGDGADREMLHGLRTVFDALLVGAGTARAEHYATIVRDEHERAQRRAHGFEPEPLTCIVSASLNVSADEVPLLSEPDARIAIVTASCGELAPVPASVAYVRAERDGSLDLAFALRQLRERHSVGSLLCEGGPMLATELISQGLLDELFLCLAAKLGGGTDAMRILAGEELRPPAPLRLISAHEHDFQLFLRYAVGAV